MKHNINCALDATLFFFCFLYAAVSQIVQYFQCRFLM